MPGQIDTQGFCLDQFAPLKDAFEKNFEEGLEIGASLCLTLEGETIVDIRGGFADREKTRPWEEDTIACVFSSTKIPTIICVLIALDRGLLELDEPIATYWPEFAQKGKGAITVRQAMTHRARVPGLRDPQPLSVLFDWDKTVGLIAAEAPWFSSDTLCYHPVTYGFILGELVRRVTGKSIRQFCHEELAEPMGADFQIGLADQADRSRVAELLHQNSLPHEEGSLPEKIFGSFIEPPEVDLWATWEMQSMVNPAVSGHTNAKGLCKFATMLSNDGKFDRKSYLSTDIIEQAHQEQYHGVDPMMGDLRLGLGFGLDSPGFKAPTPESFHWGGYGGSWCFMDSSRRLAGAYVMNSCWSPKEWGDISEPRMDRFYETVYSLFVR